MSKKKSDKISEGLGKATGKTVETVTRTSVKTVGLLGKTGVNVAKGVGGGVRRGLQKNKKESETDE